MAEHLPRSELLGAIARIMRVTKVPLTVDIEDGYSTDPREVGAFYLFLDSNKPKQLPNRMRRST